MSIYNAINARLLDDETQFWRIPVMIADCKRIHFADYYNHFSSAASMPWDGRVWRNEETCGVEFSIDGHPRADRPIIFTKFYTHDGEYLCRVPLSVASLLETNSMMNEMAIEMGLVEQLDPDSKMIEFALRGQEYKRNLYDTNLVVYTVAAHRLARIVGTDAIFDAYPLASALSTLALNLPDAAFDKIIIPDYFRPIGARAEQLRRMRDRGFAFVALAVHCAKRPFNEISLESWIESGIREAGLPGIVDLSDMARKQFDVIKASAIDGPARPRLEALLAVGQRNFEKRGLHGSLGAVFGDSDVELPPILLGDGSGLQFGSPIMGLTIDMQLAWLDSVFNYEKAIREFSEACRL